MKRFLLLALCALFTCNVAEARTLYVNAKRPNNNGNGLSAAKAKKTIQAAINIAKAGDTILVYPGTYAPIKTNNKKITIKSVKGKAKTKIVKGTKVDEQVALASLGKSYKVYITTGSREGETITCYSKGYKSTLSGFLLDGQFRTVGTFGELLGVCGGTVKSCLIQRIGNKYADTYGGGFPHFSSATAVASANLSDCVLKNNRCKQLVADAWSLADGGLGCQASTLSRCTITGNDCDSGFGSGNTLCNSLVADNTSFDALFYNVSAVNCTIAKNIVFFNWWDKFSDSSKFYNSILWNNYTVAPSTVKQLIGYDYYSADGDYIAWCPVDETTFTIDYEDAVGNSQTAEVTEGTLSNYYPGFTKEAYYSTVTSPGTRKKLHNVDSGNTYKNTDKTNKNPKFVNAAKGNYSLKKGSPFINKGKLTAAQKKLVGSTDLAGKKRIKGKAIDRGCYEF